MRRFYLNQDGKPCIWPIPADCLWTYGRYDTPAKVSVSGDFATEVRQLAFDLTDSGVLFADASEDGTGIRLLQSPDSTTGEEGYRLEADASGVCILAATAHGAFNGGRTLLQVVRNSFDPSICGVKIQDKPMKPFRGVEIPFPDKAEFQWFLRFIDVISRYKVNKLLFGIGNPRDFASMRRTGEDWDDGVYAISTCILSRHIEVIPCVEMTYGTGIMDALEAIVTLFGAKTIAVDFGSIEPSGQSSGGQQGKTAATMLAERICRIHAWLSERGTGLALLSDKLHPASGSGRSAYNEELRRNVISLPTAEAIDLIPKDILILDVNHGGISEDTASEAYFSDYGFNSVFGKCCGPVKNWEGRISRSSVQGAYVTIEEANSAALGSGGNMLAAVMRISCLLWWQGFRADHTSLGCLLPLHLEKEIAQLYPIDRDWLEGNEYPSAKNPGYCPIELREYYNSPLMHSYWRVDDHFMMFLQDAMSLPNAVPFSIFQGVLDFRFENAFVMAGGSWNNGVFGIPVNRRAGSLCFLHAYIIGKQQFIAGKDPALLDKAVGRYTIHYADGTTDCSEVVYGRNIYFWKNYYGTNHGAYAANPVFMGISEEGLHYAVYAMEWVNGKPEVEIAAVDVTPVVGMDGRIALFGITAVK